MTTTFAVDYARSVNRKSEMQRAADAATLVAASTFRDTGDKAVALERASEFFDNKAKQLVDAKAVYNFDVSENPEDGSIVAVSTIDAELGSVFKTGILARAMDVNLVSEAVLNNEPQDLYLTLLVDSTGSMRSLIDSVRDAARSLEEEVREKLEERGLTFSKLYVKVAFFGDLRFDAAPYGWRESPLYDLSKEEDIASFRSFVANTPTYNGYDLPESSPAAIAHFLTAKFPEPLDPRKTVQGIVVWTDAAGVPFDHSTISDDVTVNLYKKYGKLGTMSRYWYFSGYSWSAYRMYNLRYDEETEYDGDAIGTEENPPSYGCCSTFDVFEDRWRTGGAVSLERRSLGLIVPPAMEPWSDMDDWPNVTIRDYGTPSASGIVDDIVDSLNGKYSPLAVTR